MKNGQKSEDASSDAEAKEALAPVVEGTKELLSTFELTDSDLSEEFDDLDDSRIALIGMALVAAMSEDSEDTTFDMSNMFATPLVAQSLGSSAIDCAMIALGIDLIASLESEMGSNNNKWTKKAVKKLVGKVAVKFLGPVGVAITIASFVTCMAANNAAL